MPSTTILEYVIDGQIDTSEREEGTTMHIKMNHIVPLLAVGAAAVAIAAAPTAAAATVATGSTVHQTPGNAQITAVPGAAAQQAAQLQQPFGGDTGALLFHHFGSRSGAGRH
jgi:hypothetical protein